jgi:hypothetical protein
MLIIMGDGIHVIADGIVITTTDLVETITTAMIVMIIHIGTTAATITIIANIFGSESRLASSMKRIPL